MNSKAPISAPLDPGFEPAVLADHRYTSAVKASGRAVPMVLGVEREDGLVSRFETVVKPDADAETLRYVERTVKFLLWAQGGWRVFVGGPVALGEHLRQAYSKAGQRAFDVGLMADVYERPFEVVATQADRVPPARETSAALGGHQEGCRLGFDLGASNCKVAAVQDGKAVFSGQFPWTPAGEPDPEYHYQHLAKALREAASHLPRVDAIGGSSAGVIVNNKIRVSSLFRAVPPEYLEPVKNIFLRLRKQWGVPVEVANDGDVTALAGAMTLKANGLLGLSLGSSEAAGYINPQGRMTGWLSELAFAPIDYQAAAAADEWSGDTGVGVMYLSQQAVGKLLPAAGIRLPAEMGLPERLREVQELMAAGDPRAARIYQTIGVYLGYAILHYAVFYDFTHLLLLGGVTFGPGGDILRDQAREVLMKEPAARNAKIELCVPDEKIRRVGQAIAAASLPLLKS